MAVRVVCPSCSTALSVKDEHAGRAIKCPKCGATIPPAPPAAPPAPEEPEAPPEAPKPADVEPPAARPTARAAARSSERDDRDEPRPRRRRRDDDYDDRPRRRAPREAPQGGSNTLMVLGIVGFCLLTCCGGVGFGVYWMYNRVKETVQEARANLEKMNLLVNFQSYALPKVGSTTRTQAEQTLGPGKLATADDVQLAFANGGDPDRVAFWAEKAAQRRAVIWRNGDDFLLIAFHPNVEGDARVQLKEWRPKNGANAREGEPDDAAFLAKYPPGKFPGGPGGAAKDEEPPPGLLPEVTAEELAQAYRDNEAAASAKYKDQWWLVEGKVLDVVAGQPDDPNADVVLVKLVGIRLPNGRGDFAVWCYVRSEETRNGWNLTRGQTVKLKGKCIGGGALLTHIDLKYCRIENKGPDPSASVTAAALLADYAKNPEAANEKYKDKEVTVTGARFVSVAGDLAQFSASPKGGGTIRLQVNFSFGQRKKLEQLKPGAPVKFKAECGGLFGDHVAGYKAYIVP